MFKPNKIQFILSVADENMHSFTNLICIIIKQKIFAQKCLGRQPSAESIENEIIFIQRIEKEKAQTTGNAKNYNKRWPDKIKF